MDSVDTKQTSARAFIRSLNILLKYARLYSFDHARTAEQFNAAWAELHAAIPTTSESGLLLGAAGSQLLLDGAPIDAAPAERSFAQLLSAAGLASIQFSSHVTKEDFERLVRAFPTQNTKPSVLAEQLKTALAGVPNIRINEVRFVAEDSATNNALAAGMLTAKSLGADTDSVRDWLRDPEKLLQLIAVAEGSREKTGNGPGGGDAAENLRSEASSTKSSGVHKQEVGSAGSSSSMDDQATGSPSPYSSATTNSDVIPHGEFTGPGESVATGGRSKDYSDKSSPILSGIPGWTAKDDDVLGILKLLTSLGQTVTTQRTYLQPGPLHEELVKLPAQSQEMLRQALAAVAAQAPATNAKDPMLLRLAEHLAIKFALERYERGEVKVNAVRQMFEKMSQEIEGLRKIVGGHEQKLADAGVAVESSAELLDQQFWAAVPERNKRAVLSSPEAWCIPARNLKNYVDELLRNGDEQAVLTILRNYVACLQSEEFEARRRTAIGVAELADVYASLGGRPLAPAIQVAGAQLSVERDDNLQELISAAFVRLAQEAGLRRLFPALLQSLDSLEAVENQRPVFPQSLRPRLGVEKRVPEFLEDLLRGERKLDGLELLLQRVPRSAAENLILRFNRTSSRADMQRLVDLARAVGDELMASLRDALRSGSANEAADAAGLLSRLEPSAIQRWLPERLADDWPRQAQDRVVRLIAMSGADERGSLLVNLLPTLDPVLLPLAMDEIGLSQDVNCIPALLRIVEGTDSRPAGAFVRLKAVEGLGRLKALQAADLLRSLAEARHMFHWTHPSELRLAAVQSLAKIDSQWAKDFVPRSGFSASELYLAPLDPLPNAKYFRRRRYPRVRLSHPITAIASVGQDSYRLEIRGLSMSGGVAIGEKHLPPGTLVSLRIGSAMRPIRAQVLMRDARAQGLGFEIADMDLDERARLRKLLLENKPSAFYQEEGALAQTSA